MYSLPFTPLQSYRIRTPPSEKASQWKKSAIEFDPKSDSSDQNDLLVSTCITVPYNAFFFFMKKKKNLLIFYMYMLFSQNQSPVTHKSPGNSLKVAAMKRMRDAGWTAVTGCDKKKKTSEKIFA
uniref:Uncharacterized protein n=1 Tax=Amphilophus citrinellus TaxID=61819 RepID=A0A3Q0RNU4_AMPCI